ncbi:MAG: 5-(carboxyamino)imidazole ribonucleotide mutase [Candidatus Moraniibacteriota bacterium]
MARVMIIIGSKSDIPKMLPAKEILDGLGVGCEMHIASAHRTPKRTRELVYDAEKEGCQIFICGAGMAAHLAGAVAAITIKPVIAVPLTSDISPLAGVDALLSSVQMPPGIPVGTMPIDGAENAAWYAAQLLAMTDQALAVKILKVRDTKKEKIYADDEKLQQDLANAGRKEES